MKTLFSKIPVYGALLTLSLFLIIPFLYISQFNHPSADDFCYSDFSRSVGFWSAQVEHYLSWTGRYTATALLTVSPIDYNDLIFYRLLPVLLFLGFGLALVIFLGSVIPRAETRDKAVLGFMIFFLYLYNLPDITEAFYWMAGAVTYQLASILGLLLFSLVLYLRKQEYRSRLVLLVPAVLLSIVIVGLNEISMLLLCAIFFMWFILSSFRKRKMDPVLLVLLLFTLAAAAVVVGAPGNTVRMAEKPEKFQLFFSIFGAVKLALISLIKWAPVPLLLVFLFLKNLNRIATRYSHFSISSLHLLLFSAFSFGLIVLSFFPTFWSQGGEPPARTVNVIYLLFLFEALALVLGFLIYLQRRKGSIALLPVSVRGLIAVLVISMVALKSNNIKRVYQEVLYGKAYRYDREVQERYRMIANCDLEPCIIPPLINKPTTIFAYELAVRASQEEYYVNRCFNYYFKKSDIRIPPQERDQE